MAGANRTGWHLRGVEAGRNDQPEFADIRQPKEGDACPVCGGAPQTAIEVGHIFKLGTRYSESFGAKYLDEDGVEKLIVMGSYGIGPGRVLAAAVEQYGSEKGMIWPAEIAPYDVHVVVLGWEIPRSSRSASRLRRRSRLRASTCCSTTGSCGRARSSPTPT